MQPQQVVVVVVEVSHAVVVVVLLQSSSWSQRWATEAGAAKQQRLAPSGVAVGACPVTPSVPCIQVTTTRATTSAAPAAHATPHLHEPFDVQDFHAYGLQVGRRDLKQVLQALHSQLRQRTEETAETTRTQPTLHVHSIIIKRPTAVACDTHSMLQLRAWLPVRSFAVHARGEHMWGLPGHRWRGGKWRWLV